MTDIELKEFYDNINNMSSFLRIRKIYELTNNLDEYLLYQLKRDFFVYYAKKLKDEISDSKSYNQEDVEAVFGDILSNEDFENYLEGLDYSFTTMFDYEYLENMLDNTKDFVNEIESLIDIENSKKRLQIGYYYDYKSKVYVKVKTDEEVEAEEGTEQESEDTSKLSTSMKVLYLEKLGIINFLKKEEPFSTSTNKLAKVLSRIIDAKTISIQPCLNAMLSKNTSSKNNPLNSETNIGIVQESLTNLGFKSKTNDFK